METIWIVNSVLLALIAVSWVAIYYLFITGQRLEKQFRKNDSRQVFAREIKDVNDLLNHYADRVYNLDVYVEDLVKKSLAKNKTKRRKVKS